MSTRTLTATPTPSPSAPSAPRAPPSPGASSMLASREATIARMRRHGMPESDVAFVAQMPVQPIDAALARVLLQEVHNAAHERRFDDLNLCLALLCANDLRDVRALVLSHEATTLLRRTCGTWVLGNCGADGVSAQACRIFHVVWLKLCCAT